MHPLDQQLECLKRLHPRRIDLSLARIERLLTRLGRPHERLPPVVHVAGTNGKGSVTAMLRAMLEAAGRRVHAFTSPHLVRFAEQIFLADADGRARAIAEDRLSRLLEHVEDANAGEPITLFEITTAAAFLAFSETPVDAVLLEVGLGGRLDATNVVRRPRLTVITPVAVDHAELLGDTVAKIAAEKAGILKRGVRGIIAQQSDEAMPVIIAQADRIGAPLTVWGRDYEAFEQSGRLVFQKEDRLLDLARPALHGRHQIGNAGVAIAAALELGLPERAIERGLLEVSWPARLQRLASGPLLAGLAAGVEVWLDGGHNAAGGAALAQALADLEERAPKPLHLVAGMLAHKDAAGFLGHFRGLARSVATVPVPAGGQAPFEPEGLAALARALGLEAWPAASLGDALVRLGRDVPPCRIVICGSLYLAGHVLALQTGKVQQVV